METLKARLINASIEQNIAIHIIEQDYALSWILAGIADHPVLSHLVFKGGTCLRKCYFGDYRFSQDLDFTLLVPIDKEDLYSHIKDACLNSKGLLKNSGQGCEIVCKEYQADRPHPHGQNAYAIAMQLPWHRKHLVSIFIEITRDEVVIVPMQTKNIIHGYGENIAQKVQVYCLEEIIMEKLRATLQQIIKLHERGWGRSRARDFYDIWMIFNKYGEVLDLNLITQNIDKKFAIKDIIFKSKEDFYDQKYITELIRTWHQWLDPFVQELPPSEIVLDDLKHKILPQIFK